MLLDDLLDLIADVQTTTRKEANVSAHDQSVNPSPLTSFRDVIPRLESSPHCLRCQHCLGPLLNGDRSVSCIFCGTVPKTRPNTIHFSSTNGCEWFLDALQLNGSEACGLPNEEETQAGSGQNLSKLLELEIHWTAPLTKSTVCEKVLEGLEIGGVNRSIEESNSGSLNEKEDGWEADFQFVSVPDAVESQRLKVADNKAAKLDSFPVRSVSAIDSSSLDLVVSFDGKQDETSRGTASRDDLLREDGGSCEMDWFKREQRQKGEMRTVGSDASTDDISNWETNRRGEELERVKSRMHDLSFMLQPKLSLPHQ